MNIRTNNIETQTVDSHSKTRLINTDHIKKTMTGAFVSNYDMHDTYNLDRTIESVRIDVDNHHEQLNITTYSKNDYNLSHELGTSKSFQLSSMILQRILAGNIYHESQRRFRNIKEMEPQVQIVRYSYCIKMLCRYRHYETYGNAVSCIAWNPKNTDILAIGYGVSKYQTFRERKHSAVCLWNIKVIIITIHIYDFFHLNAFY